MKWKKLGRIFDPKEHLPSDHSCALMPIVEIIQENQEIVRVYYSPRDSSNRSQLRFFDYSIPKNEVIKLDDKLLFKHGKLGAFDDCGVTPGSFSEINGKIAYYYTGWSLTQTVPMNNSIGVALWSEEYQQFQRIGDGPILTRNLHEPYSCASPFVLKRNDKYQMWYASMDGWKKKTDNPVHIYNLKYAESSDGINWIREGVTAISYSDKTEYAFGRPFVLVENNIYKMWYAVRGDFYRIGYAESCDGVEWTRKDHLAGIDVSTSGWDDTMIEYPFIIDLNNKRYMFYNGNGYGRSGVGLAVLE
jgi:hypothetical protein